MGDLQAKFRQFEINELNLDYENVEDRRNYSFTQPPTNIFTSDGSNIFTDSESVASEISVTNPRKDDAINYDKYATLFDKSSINQIKDEQDSSMTLLHDYNAFKRKLTNQRSLHK